VDPDEVDPDEVNPDEVDQHLAEGQLTGEERLSYRAALQGHRVQRSRRIGGNASALTTQAERQSEHAFGGGGRLGVGAVVPLARPHGSAFSRDPTPQIPDHRSWDPHHSQSDGRLHAAGSEQEEPADWTMRVGRDPKSWIPDDEGVGDEWEERQERQEMQEMSDVAATRMTNGRSASRAETSLNPARTDLCSDDRSPARPASAPTVVFDLHDSPESFDSNTMLRPCVASHATSNAEALPGALPEAMPRPPGLTPSPGPPSPNRPESSHPSGLSPTRRSSVELDTAAADAEMDAEVLAYESDSQSSLLDDEEFDREYRAMEAIVASPP